MQYLYINQVLEKFPTYNSHENSEEIVEISARVTALRGHGKSGFAALSDVSGKIQLYAQQNVNQEAFNCFSNLSVGDIVKVIGPIFRTKTNELTIRAQELMLLTNNSYPLPSGYYGIENPETKYRQRYLDIIANSSAQPFIERSKMISNIRKTLDGHNFLEVETPILQSHPIGATAEPFITKHNSLGQDMFLRIAPELYLKRLLVAGFPAVYEIGRNFRNEGISNRHNPEFTMLEFYRAGWNYLEMIDFTKLLLATTNPLFLTAKTVTLKSLVDTYCFNNKVTADNDDETTMAIYEKHVEPTLVEPIFVTEFPSSVSPLAKTFDNNSKLAERFELVVNGVEIANGYSELTNPEQQLAAFEKQGVIDEDYITALKVGLIPCAGCGIGIDRLAMLNSGVNNIRDVILFPTLKNKDV